MAKASVLAPEGVPARFVPPAAANRGGDEETVAVAACWATTAGEAAMRFAAGLATLTGRPRTSAGGVTRTAGGAVSGAGRV